MQLVKGASANIVVASSSTTIQEFLMTDPDLSAAVAHIRGRYPETGFAKNEVSKELVYVIHGTGKILTPSGEQTLNPGDVVLLANNELFAWEGNFKIFMATAPTFDPAQHKVSQ